MEEALTRVLLGASPVRQLVDIRITWNTLPQGSGIPAIVLQRIGGRPVNDSGGATALESSRVQVDCFGGSSDEARGVGRAVKGRLSGIAETIEGVRFASIEIDDERSDFEEAGAKERRHRVSIDLIIWFRSAP